MLAEKVKLSDLNQRLNQLLPRLESDEFLNNLGLGNEIGFYVFDYPAEAELTVRDHLAAMTQKLMSREKNFANINLFAEVVSLLESRNLLTPAFKKQKMQGDDVLFNALKGPLEQNRFAEFIVSKIDMNNCEFILMHGLGNAWPIIRGHELLNALHAKVGAVPTLLFYPGEWDGLALKAFSRMESNNYYRAFKLVL